MTFTKCQAALLAVAVALASMCLGRIAQIGLVQLTHAAHVAHTADE
jgi:hypothetical protein